MLAGVRAAVPLLGPTQAVNLALLTNAVLAKRTLGLSELTRPYPPPAERRGARPADKTAAGWAAPPPHRQAAPLPRWSSLAPGTGRPPSGGSPRPR